MSSFLHDLRHAARVLCKTPGFTVAAVLVLAAAIGVNTAVFTFVHAFLLRPLPGREKPGEVVGVYAREHARPDTYHDFSYPAYAAIRNGEKGPFTDLMAFSLTFAGIADGDVSRRTLVSVVTANYFSTLGVSLAAGRPFTADDERPGASLPVAIVSHAYAAKRGGLGTVMGGTLLVNNRPFRIVGVAPRGFTGTVANFAPEAWLPTGAWNALGNDASGRPVSASLADRNHEALMIVGRLAPGVSQSRASAALPTLAARMAAELPAGTRPLELQVATLSRLTISSRPLSDRASFGYSAIAMVLASLVLVIAGMNLANMMLARGTARRKEVAMRLALGASRAVIVRQMLIEGLLLSLAGGAGGLLLSYWSGRLVWSSFERLSPIPIQFDPTPGTGVLLVTLAFCAIGTLLFGLGPAWQLSRTDLVTALKTQAGSGAADASRRRWSTHDLLVAGQFALSMALLITAGLFVRGALKAAESDPGYRFENRAVATLDASLGGYDEARARGAYRDILARVRRAPAVESATLSSSVAFGTLQESASVQRVGSGATGGTSEAMLAVVGSGYFRTLGLPMLRGRDFLEAEESDATRVAIIDAPLARTLFGTADPVGRQIVVEHAGEPCLVVGVAPGLRQSLRDKGPVAHVYLPAGAHYRPTTNLHVHFRAGTAMSAGLEALRREVRAADGQVPVLALLSLAEHRNATTAYWAVRIFAQVLATFGLLALFLAVVGLYSVKAYLVARQTRDIGIRMALGSTPGQITRLVIAAGLRLNLGALALGMALAVGIGHLVAALLYDVSAFDPVVFVATPALLTLVMLTASYLPARRAARVSPMAALRTE